MLRPARRLLLKKWGLFTPQRPAIVDRTRQRDQGKNRGSSAIFADPEAYRKRDPGMRLAVNSSVHHLLQGNEMLRNIPDAQQQSSAEMACVRTPRNAQERRLSKLHDEKELQLSGDPANAPFDRSVHRFFVKENLNLERFKQAYPQEPTGAERYKLKAALRRDHSRDKAADQLREKLAREYGIFSSQRLDAYMLGDDNVFPKMMDDLPVELKDAVKFGALGLTEDDEVLRVTLSRLPLDRRKAEWERLKRARAYRDGSERRLSPSEIRAARLAKRRHFALHRKQLRRSNMLKQLALGQPDVYETWPAGKIDYSKRVATIAQHVEARLATKGQWPLDAQALQLAKIRCKQEQAEQEFLNPEGQRATRRKISPFVTENLKKLERDPKPLKRLSRKAYQSRWSAVYHGYKDEYGHSLRIFKARQKGPKLRERTAQEHALEREGTTQMHVSSPSRMLREVELWPEMHRHDSMRPTHPTFR